MGGWGGGGGGGGGGGIFSCDPRAQPSIIITPSLRDHSWILMLVMKMGRAPVEGYTEHAHEAYPG